MSDAYERYKTERLANPHFKKLYNAASEKIKTTIDCLWCSINPVTQEGEVCSYECYGTWIMWYKERGVGIDDSRHGDIIKVEEGMPVMLPLELQTFYRRTWKDMT